MEITCTSTPCASMSFSRSSGVKRTLGEVKAVRLPPPITVPIPSPGSWRKPCQSRWASAACHRDRGTRCAWMSMVFMNASFLEVEEPAGRRLHPFLLRVLVEHEPLVGGGDAPCPRGQLGFELARSPSGVAQEEQRPAWTRAPGPRLKHRWILGDREATDNHGGALACPVRPVQDGAALLLDPPAVVDSDVAAAGRHLETERLQRPLERNLRDGPVDD